MNSDYDTLRAIENSCYRWLVNSPNDTIEFRPTLESIKMTIIVTRWRFTDDTIPSQFIPNRINVCPDDPQTQNIFKKYFLKATWIDPNNELYSFPNHIYPYTKFTQCELHFFPTESAMRDAIKKEAEPALVGEAEGETCVLM